MNEIQIDEDNPDYPIIQMSCEFTNMISNEEWHKLWNKSKRFDLKQFMIDIFREHNPNMNREYYLCKLMKWKHKKTNRKHNRSNTKKVLYESRSKVAKSRQRINGRFMSNK
jgi:hypothetical protein